MQVLDKKMHCKHLSLVTIDVKLDNVLESNHQNKKKFPCDTIIIIVGKTKQD